jgi:serine/threonine-protein kinase
MSEGIVSSTVFANRYHIISKLGAGGMGVVYHAHDLKLEYEVALKMIRHEHLADAQIRKWLYQEVKLARAISHHNVAHIYDLGEWEDHEFFSMEYIDGQTLQQRLQNQGPMPWPEGKQVLRQICQGLLAAHQVGVIHRDLKPSNIMLAPQGRVVLVDFGIAQQSTTGTDAPLLKMAGTPKYVAPEVLSNGPIDHRADIYSLGIVAIEIFCGLLPRASRDLKQMANISNALQPLGPETNLSPLPPQLATLIMQCLEVHPDNRLSSVQSMLSLLPEGISGFPRPKTFDLAEQQGVGASTIPLRAKTVMTKID